MNKTLTTLSAAMLVSAAATATAGDNPFASQALNQGYQLAGHHMEGKCGEGKCGAKSETEGKCGEGKCGGAK